MLGSLELELLGFVSNHVGAGIKPRSSARAASSFNYGIISPALMYTHTLKIISFSPTTQKG
ncbi:hypothetical protein ACQP3F_32900, partial [Escherichia coli]